MLANAEQTVDGVPTYATLILFGTQKAVGRYRAQAEAVFEYRNSKASLPYQQRVEFRRCAIGPPHATLAVGGHHK